ncbi:MAG: electron transfer flavoprotein subunit beta/FixA family protein [Syntrophales bacterium]|jgi:electron transfer flavoprotein beta subunit|nr:electron transfer flavoprotein subunit beta/FixA family protein [Syntrophales bacterium]MDY0043087.1 electron transfer flavoprotein subunit beta/FixA family protein [Syntrophales bacterium]
MSFHCIACIKAAALKAPAKGMKKNSDTAQMNPFDRIALALAVNVARSCGGMITALSMGPASCSFVIYEAMAMGADKGILLSDRRFADSDTLATSTALAAAIKRLAPFDLVVFGARTSDSDTGQVGPQTAVALDLPLVSGTFDFEWKNSFFLAHRKMDEFRETYEVTLPAAFTIHPSSITPPDIALENIETAWTKKIAFWSLEDLELRADQVGLEGSPTRVISQKMAARKRHCEFIEGSVEEQAEKFVRKIKEKGII